MMKSLSYILELKEFALPVKSTWNEDYYDNRASALNSSTGLKNSIFFPAILTLKGIAKLKLPASLF